jgi:hypothetical protein
LYDFAFAIFCLLKYINSTRSRSGPEERRPYSLDQTVSNGKIDVMLKIWEPLYRVSGSEVELRKRSPGAAIVSAAEAVKRGSAFARDVLHFVPDIRELEIMHLGLLSSVGAGY